MSSFLTKRSKLATSLGLLVLLGAATGLQGQKFARQEATLRITINGQNVGTEHYRITYVRSNLEAQADIRMEVNGTKVRQTTSLTLSPNAEPRSYEWRMEEPRKMHVRVKFSGGKAIATYPLESGKENRQEFHFNTDRVALLDNNVFHHYGLFARLYDYKSRGVQSFPVFIPQSIQPGNATMESKGTESLLIGGRKVLARRLDVITADNLVKIWVGENGELLRLEVPSAKVVVEPEP